MAREMEPIDGAKAQIVRALFVNTADDNYITARWCFVERLNVDYLWLAVHALEKYMKAILLLNGESAKDGRHDIAQLYTRVKPIAQGLLPTKLEKPDGVAIKYWTTETPETFVERLHRNGNEHNRYQLFGFVQRPEDLLKLDAMVFALRRLCVPLDAYAMGKWRAKKTNRTNRDDLARQPEWWHLPLTGNLEKTANGKRGERLRETMLNGNVRFAPEGFPHVNSWTGTFAARSVLAHEILDPLEKSPDSGRGALAAELCDWVLGNIYLPRDVKQELRNASAKRRP